MPHPNQPNPNEPQQPPAHHFDPDMSDAILLAMLDNPHHADAVAAMSDDDLNQIAADVPLDDSGDESSPDSNS